jgi:cytoskeletal protein CcmA (bactofilin family)
MRPGARLLLKEKGMFGRQRPDADSIEVIIGPHASFSGDLRCDTSIRIDGVVDGGHVETPVNVILTETARVQCDIVAKTVSIRGVFRGVIRAERVELLKGSQVFGALHINSFYMDDGVLLRAEVDIQGATPEELGQLPRPEGNAAIPVISTTRSSTP